MRVTLSKVTMEACGSWNYPASFLDHPIQIDRPVPSALLGVLGIGGIWKNGELVVEPNYCSESFELSISENNNVLIKAGVNDAEQGFILPFNLHPYHKHHTHSYCIQVSLPDGPTITIAALELFRFYFGTSGSLISRLLHAPFESNRLWIKAEIDEFGKADIDLAKGIAGSSAPDVARIAFDKQALHAAKLFTNSILTSHNSDNRVYPKMLFPFKGKTKLHVKGVWLDNNFLVFRIISCSHRFPFHSLRYTMTRRKITINHQTPEDGKLTSNALVNSGKQDPSRSDLKDIAPDKELAQRQKKISTQARFPDLEDKYIVRTDPEVAARLLHDSTLMTNGISVGDGENKSELRPIELVSINDVQSPKGHPLEGSEFAQYVEDYAKDLSKPECTIKFVALNHRQKYPQFSLMPELIDEHGEIHYLSLMEKNKKLRSRYVSIIITEYRGVKNAHMILEGEDGKQPGFQLIVPLENNSMINIIWVGDIIRKVNI